MVHNMYRFVGVVEYGDRLHVIAAGLSARAHRVPPAKARLYMASLEEFASKIVSREYGYVNIDAYTYVVAAHRFTRGVYSLAGVDKNKSPDYSIARLYLTYEQLCYLLPRILCNLYSSRCSRHYDGHRARHSMCPPRKPLLQFLVFCCVLMPTHVVVTRAGHHTVTRTRTPDYETLL